MKRPKLRLVGKDDLTGVFSDMGKLRGAYRAPTRRARSLKTFARIPHDQGLELARKMGDAALAVLIELDRLILKTGENPVRLWSAPLRHAGIVGRVRHRALRKLEAAGAIKVEQRGAGLSPLIAHLWYQRNQ
jgi:hypothetical protein